ncbi:hypothetical protein M23134_07756 [Microscilla marina ATCC 23134]|uniref:Uncharacterized protein n=1 Tax=Microscilla marina ATCC 23134 TaxID=313606 RepID=A1ZLA4_MICM2|nr:hypothetical protein M23134_07756 [Microscilla marina ATCC 23134]
MAWCMNTNKFLIDFVCELQRRFTGYFNILIFADFFSIYPK